MIEVEFMPKAADPRIGDFFLLDDVPGCASSINDEGVTWIGFGPSRMNLVTLSRSDFARSAVPFAIVYDPETDDLVIQRAQ